MTATSKKCVSYGHLTLRLRPKTQQCLPLNKIFAMLYQLAMISSTPWARVNQPGTSSWSCQRTASSESFGRRSCARSRRRSSSPTSRSAPEKTNRFRTCSLKMNLAGPRSLPSAQSRTCAVSRLWQPQHKSTSNERLQAAL